MSARPATNMDDKSLAQMNSGTKDDATPDGSLSSIHRVFGDPSHRDVKWTTNFPKGKPAEDAFSLKHAMTSRYKLSSDPSKTLDLHSIVVQSPLLKKSLAKVLKNYQGVTVGLKRVEIMAPFECVVHRWEGLLAEREALGERKKKRRERLIEKKKKGESLTGESATELQNAIDHMELFYTTLHGEIADVIQERDDLVAHGVMKYELLYTIFEPGLLVYMEEDGQDRICKVTSMNFNNEEKYANKRFSVRYQWVRYDGTNFGCDSQTVYISHFSGTKKITNLPIYPLTAHADPEELKARLTARGKMFEALKGLHFLSYNGVAFSGGSRYHVKSRIIIDAKSHIRKYRSRLGLDTIRTWEVDQTDDSPASGEDSDDGCVVLPKRPGQKSARSLGQKPIPAQMSLLTPEQHLLASPFVLGYSLRDRKWLTFLIDNIEDIVWQENAFNSLVMSEEQKALILSFAESQMKNRGGFDDVIKGKGQGIIMLLAGTPGVGKTLTAESVAEEMGAPLYSIGAADLGNTPAELESALREVLELCSKWKAVLLLDEADVFMESRSTSDLERNKLVAIFLRLLEYYTGIMFLTTNRQSDMDPAFESRIHLTLTYTDLDKASRKQIWGTFLASHARCTGANEGRNVFTDAELERLAREKLNGRQIKNLVKTGGLLAGRYGEGLGMGHLETVLRLRRANERRTVGFFGGE